MNPNHPARIIARYATRLRIWSGEGMWWFGQGLAVVLSLSSNQGPVASALIFFGVQAVVIPFGWWSRERVKRLEYEAAYTARQNVYMFDLIRRIVKEELNDHDTRTRRKIKNKIHKVPD